MKLLQNAKISTKIIALLLMLGAVTMFIAWNGSRRLLETDAAYAQALSVRAPDVTKMARVNRFLIEMLYAGYRTVLYDGGTATARAAAKEESTAYEGAVKAMGEIRRSEPELTEEVNHVAEKIDAVHALTARASVLGLANRNDDATALLTQADAMTDGLKKQIFDFNEGRNAQLKKLSDDLTAASDSTSTMMLIVAVLGVLGGVAVSILVAKIGITGPLSRLQGQMGDIAASDYARDVDGTNRGDEVGAMAMAVRVFRENGMAKQAADAAKARADAEQQMVVTTVASHLSELSHGDLTAAIRTDFPGEYGALKTNFNDALGKLRELIGSVTESAATIRTGSGEIAQASEDLARRTESNAASLEETAASVAQMDGRLKASATAATRTVERADQAIATVGGGRAVADEAVQAMGRVSESAKGIDNVIEGLDKIAFQTRVLAMNAAVEAGRAGEAGRGFAVVADLVSALAMRAEEEAKRARDQLTVTQSEVGIAVQAVQKVDGALADISGDVGQVHELLATMAADNMAQSAAITQISTAIGAMDQSTQQNAAMVEETSAAARNLSSEVGALSEQASRFNVGSDGHVRVPRVAVQAPPRKPAGTAARRPAKQSGSDYVSPVKPLPATGLAGASAHWKDF